jgi:hypothetical protein
VTSDSRVIVRLREFRLGRSQRVRVGGQLSEEVRVRSGVLQGPTSVPLVRIWINTESTIRFYADDYVIYRRMMTAT